MSESRGCRSWDWSCKGWSSCSGTIPCLRKSAYPPTNNILTERTNCPQPLQSSMPSLSSCGAETINRACYSSILSVVLTPPSKLSVTSSLPPSLARLSPPPSPCLSLTPSSPPRSGACRVVPTRCVSKCRTSAPARQACRGRAAAAGRSRPGGCASRPAPRRATAARGRVG